MGNVCCCCVSSRCNKKDNQKDCEKEEALLNHFKNVNWDLVRVKRSLSEGEKPIISIDIEIHDQYDKFLEVISGSWDTSSIQSN